MDEIIAVDLNLNPEPEVTVGVLMNRIDGAAADVYTSVAKFRDEYNAKELAARSFKSAGFEGNVSSQVSSFATAAGLSNRDAAMVIIGQAEQFKAALDAIAELRMQKFAIEKMPLDMAQAKTDEVVAQIAAIGAQL